MIAFGNHRKYWMACAIALVTVVPRGEWCAQTQTSELAKRTFTLEQAVDFALKTYPAVRATLERSRAAEAGAGGTSYLPRTDIVWQKNRATANNITGLLIPNSVIAPITGPVAQSPSNQSVWGSAGGLLFSWEPLGPAAKPGKPGDGERGFDGYQTCWQVNPATACDRRLSRTRNEERNGR